MLKNIVSKLLWGKSNKSRKRSLDSDEEEDDGDEGQSHRAVDDNDDNAQNASDNNDDKEVPEDDGLVDSSSRPDNDDDDDDDDPDNKNDGDGNADHPVTTNTTSVPSSSSSSPTFDDVRQLHLPHHHRMAVGFGALTPGSTSVMAPPLPPPKRKKAQRVIEAAEDWCETDANWQDIQYRWTINSFSKCQEELGNYVTSPEFPSALMPGGDVADRSLGPIHVNGDEFAFYLKVHLKGETEESDHLAVYIVCKGPEDVLASFELSIIVDQKKLNSRDSKKICHFSEDQHPAWGFKKFIQFDDLQDEEKGYLEDDCLTLQCEVKFVLVKNLRPVHKNWGEASFKAENRVEEGMERLDIDQLWRDRALYADVTIVCQDREIPANRVMLATRSEVFSAMFSHPTKEAASGRIEISDVDGAVFERMLAYIYTGFAPNVHPVADELLQLLIAANKYALEELKTICVRELARMLSCENVLEMLRVGDQHEAASLKDAAFAFLVKRHDVFMDKNFKVLWHKFKEAHPDLTTETVKVLLERQPVAKFP